MLDLLVVKEAKSLKDLLGVKLDGILLHGTVLRQDVCQTGVELFQVNAEELVKQLTTVKLHNVLVT